jgi:hypothetical protein
MAPPPISSAWLLSPCNDHEVSAFHIHLLHNPLTPASYSAFGAVPCSETNPSSPDLQPGESHMSSAQIVSAGAYLQPFKRMAVPAHTRLAHMGFHLSSEVRYSLSLLEAGGQSLDVETPAHLFFDGSRTEDGLGAYVYRQRFGAIDGGGLPPSGVLDAGKMDFGVEFFCGTAGNPYYYDRDGKARPEEDLKASVVLRLETWMAAPPYTQYQDLLLPFTKYCPVPEPPPPGWQDGGYGSPDDLGHLAGALPMFLYCLVLLITSFPRSTRFLKSLQSPPLKFLGGLVSPQPYGCSPALLDPLVLLFGGSIPALIHFNTLSTTNASMHELYHFLAHLFTGVMGGMSLAIRLR